MDALECYLSAEGLNKLRLSCFVSNKPIITNKQTKSISFVINNRMVICYLKQ